MRPRCGGFLAFAVMAGACGLDAGIARADEPGGDARALADAAFGEGKALLDSGQVEAACAKFARSQELDPKLGRLLNLAFCHEQEGKTASAWNEYNGAAALAEQKGQTERLAFAHERAESVAKRLAFIHLDVPPEAASVEVDGAGVARDRWATPLALDPGEHKVVVSAPGKKARTISVTVGGKPGMQDVPIPSLEDQPSAGAAPAAPATTSAQTEGEPAPTTPPAPAERPADQGTAANRNLTPAFIAGGVAVASLGLGVVSGIVAMSKKSAADPDCPDKLCTPQGRALISSAQSAATVSTVGFGVGLVATGVTAWFFVRPPGGASSSASVACYPVVGPHLAGLGLEESW